MLSGMNVIDRSITQPVKKVNYAKWVKAAFFVYLFFVLFGTGLPFQASLQERATEGGNIDGSNTINQLLSLAYLVGLICLIGKQNQVIAFIRKEKFLSLFLLWTLGSVFWSNYPMVSLKRWIVFFGEAVLCLSVLLNIRWSEELIRYFRILFFIYLPLTILSVLFIPEAVQYENNSWRGLTITKNNLGQVALFSIIIFLTVISYHRKKAINIFHYAMLGLGVVCYIGARSTTSLMVGIFLFAIAFLLYLGRNITHSSLAHYYASIVFFSSLTLLGFVMVVAPEIPEAIVGIFGKDLTFTDRVFLWERIIDMTRDRLIMGWGLGGFWVMEGAHLIPLFQEFVWIPNQAHQGYLDILNQTGIVGLSLLVFMVLNYIGNLPRLKKREIWKWFFLGVLVFNFQESVFFRPRQIGHFMFILAYVAFYTDLIKETRLNRSISESLLPVRYVTR